MFHDDKIRPAYAIHIGTAPYLNDHASNSDKHLETLDTRKKHVDSATILHSWNWHRNSHRPDERRDTHRGSDTQYADTM